MRRGFQTALRWGLMGLLGSLLFVLVVAAAACAYLSTEHGRARLLGAVVAEVDRALPGTISAGQLSLLTPTAVELLDLSLRAGGGNEVAMIQRARARIAPWSLLGGRVVVEELVLQNAAVDLRALDDPRVGLLSALVTPSSGAEPEANRNSAPIVVFEALRIENCQARLPAAFGAAPDELWLTTFSGRLAVGAELQLDVQHLRARVRRESADIGGVRVSGQLHTLGRSHLVLAGTLGGVELGVDLAQGEAGRPLTAWASSPIVLALSLGELTAARLAALTGTLPPPLLGAFGAHLSLHGTPSAFEADGTLQTPGGAIAFNGRGRGLVQLELAAQIERLALGRLAPSLPDRHISAQLSVGLERQAGSTPGLRASLAASTRVDGVALPRLSLRAEQAEGSPWQLALQLDDRWLALAAEGQLKPDGALHAAARGWLAPAPGLELARALGLALDPAFSGPWGPAGGDDRLGVQLELSRSAAGSLDANATLGASKLELGGGRIEQLAVTLSLAGQLPWPRVRVSASCQAALRGSAQLTPGRLELEGGPDRYRFDLHGGTRAALRASGWVEREARGQRFALNAAGRYGGAPWRIDVRPAQRLDSGHVILPGVDVELDEQRLHLHGQYAGAESRVVLELDDVDVERALRPFLPEPKLVGVLGGRVEAHGTPARPALALRLHASRFGVAGAPTLDARIEAALEQGGQLTLDASAREHGKSTRRSPPRLDVRVTGDGRVDPRLSWPAILASGEQRIELSLTRLDSSLLDELVGSAAPASLDGRGHAELRVVRGVPALDYSIDGRVTWAGHGAEAEARPLTAQLSHTFSHDGRRLRTELTLDDDRGRWVSLEGDAGLPLEPLPDLVRLSAASSAEWARWLRAASWHVALDAAPRGVDALPALPNVPDLGGAQLGFRLEGRQAPHAAPVGTLAFQTAQTPRQVPRRGCSSRPLTTHGYLALASNRFGAALEMFDGQTRLLRAGTGGEIDVERWLGGDPPRWEDLEISVDATRVPLDGLPLACGKLRGELTGSGTIRDPLGSLQLKADLAIAGFSLGSDQTVDLGARVSIDPKQLELSGDVTAEGRRSPFEIRWPRASAPDGAAAPARVASIELARLPLAPLLPLEGPISHVSGYLSGKLRASRSGGARELVGMLRLEQVALTITELAQPLSDISGELGFRDGSLVLRRLSARDGDGDLTLDGALKLHGGRSFDGDFKLVTRKFPLRQAGDVVARTSAAARIEMGWRPDGRRLHVTLEDFDTWLEQAEGSRGLSLEPHPDVRVKVRRSPTYAKSGATAATEASPTGGAPQVPLIVEIDAIKQFWVKRADFALKLSANLRVATGGEKTTREQSNVDVTGQLLFERGYMEMLGKSFEVKRGGTLRFTGGTSAVLNLSAQYEDRRTDKLVLVQLQGSADAPKLEFQVDGRKVSAGEAFQAIYGSEATSDDVDPEAQASQIIGAMMAGVLTTSMRRRLGAMAPILSVDPSDENRGEQLRAGFELDALIPDFLRDIVTGVYVEGSFSSEKQEDQAGSKDVQTGVLIELHFPYNLISSGRYGPDTTWSLDLGWQP